MGKTTYIVPEEVVLQGSSGFQPDPLLRVLVRQEESVLVGGSESLDLGQAVSDLSASLQRRCLKLHKYLG